MPKLDIPLYSLFLKVNPDLDNHYMPIMKPEELIILGVLISKLGKFLFFRIFIKSMLDFKQIVFFE